MKAILDKETLYTMNSFDAYLYSTANEMLIGRADALSNSSFTVTNEMTPVNGGSLNQVLYYIPTGKTIAVALTSVAFEESWLAIQTGEKWVIGNYQIDGQTASLSVINDNGTRTIEMPVEPVGKYVYVISGSNSIPVSIPTTNPKIIDVTNITGDEDTCLEVNYAALIEAQHLAIKGDSPPTVIKLVLKKKVYIGSGSTTGDGTSGRAVKQWTIVIPKYQPDGNVEIAGALGSNDTYTLNGNAIGGKSSVCGDNQQVLADVYIEMIGDEAYQPMMISTDPSYEVAVGGEDDILVFAQLGSEDVYQPFDVSAKCEYSSADPSKVTVTSSGKINGVTATAGDPVEITITYSGLTTTTEVIVV